MRALTVILSISAISRAGAQCSPAITQLTKNLEYDRARAEIQGILKTNPNDDVALHCMGRIYMTEGKSGDAVDWYEKAVKINDKNARHHLDLAEALGAEAEKASKFRQPFLARRVKTELERTVELDPNLVDAHYGLMQFYMEAPGIMGGSMDKAREQARTVAKLSPYEGHQAAAEIAQHEKDTVTAESEYKAAIAAAPDSTDARVTLGRLYEIQKRWPDAFALYEQWMKDKPADASPHYLYGRVAVESGLEQERGEREIRYWFANLPKDASTAQQSTAHLRLGMIAEKQGKKDVARAEYQSAVTINPKNADAQKKLDVLR